MQEREAAVIRSPLFDPTMRRATTTRWHALLEGSLQTRAREAALFIAARMRDPATVAAQGEAAEQLAATRSPGYLQTWPPVTSAWP